jgi:hypothetical protein
MAMPAIKVEEKKARKRYSYKTAVKRFCIECFGGGRGGRKMGSAISAEIRECTDPECPLFEVRPFKN